MYLLKGFTIFFVFIQCINCVKTIPFAKCSVISEQFNASAQVFVTDLIPALDVSNLTNVITAFESNVLKHFKSLNSRLTNVESYFLNNNKLDNIDSDILIRRRKVEIQTFNATIHTEKNGVNMFTYFWKLKGIGDILNNKKSKSIRSQSFYIHPKGYRMYLKFLPKFNSDMFHLQAGVSKGEYDDELAWPFALKYRISVLEQDPVDNVEDIVSKIWNPENVCKKTFWLKPVSDNHGCVGVSFTEEMLRSKNYIKEDSIIVKFTVYLK